MEPGSWSGAFDPGDELSIAKHRYDMPLLPHDLALVGPPPVEDQATDLMKQSLLERAGLEIKGATFACFAKGAPHGAF